MGREVRRVPKDWQHPKGLDGRWIPLHDGDYETAAKEWLEGLRKWEAGDHPERGKYGCNYYWEYYGGPPNGPEDAGGHMYARPRDDLTHYMLYETTTEGTPLSPAFETIEEVAAWAADNATTFASYTATREEWLKMLRADFVCARDGNMIFV